MNCPRCGYYLENPNVAACPNCGQPLSAGAYGAPQNPNPYGQPPQSGPYGQPPNPYGQPAAPSQPMYPPPPGTYPPPNPQMYAPPSQPMYQQQAPYGQPQGMPGMPPGGTPFQPPKRGAGPLVRVLIGVVVVGVVIFGITFASGLLKGGLGNGSIYSSSLTGNVSDWPSGQGCSPQGDGFHITAAVACYPDLDDQGDVTLSVQAKQLSGESNTAYGITFRRVSEGNHYFFGIDGNGKWIFAAVKNGDPNVVVDFTPNAAINGGLNQINTLKVAAKGGHFTFFVNGTQVGSSDDSTFSSGKWGLEGQDGIEVVFTNIAITKTA